jgi:peptidoglycan biosynthesis protein MviN/MurJ (putative lipid II flippase)
MALNLALCVLLSDPLKLGGIALAGTISALCNGLCLLYLLRRRLGHGIVDRSVLVSFLKSLAASLALAAITWYLYRLLQDLMTQRRVYNALLTLALIAAGLVVFVAVNLLLRNSDILELVRAFRKRLRGS